MRSWPMIFVLSAAVLGIHGIAHPADSRSSLSVFPPTLELRGRTARHQLLVSETVGERVADRTRVARFRSDNTSVAQVNSAGVVTPTGDGTTSIDVSFDGR